MFGNLGFSELIIILVILLLLFGARRLPELAKSMGQSVRAFKKGIAEPQLEDKQESAAAPETKKMAEKVEVDR